MPQPGAVPDDAPQREIDRVKDLGRKAVQSIPAYVEICDFVMILAPCGRHINRTDRNVNTCYRTWRRRGWCLVELVSSFFCRDAKSPAMVVRSAEGNPYFVSPLNVTLNAIGHADFTCCERNHMMPDKGGTMHPIECDKFVVRRIMETMIRKKVSHLYDEVENATMARLFQVFSHWFLRGLPRSDGKVDGIEDDAVDDNDALKSFMTTLRWTTSTTTDMEWFDVENVSLLFYAAGAKKLRVVRALLKRLSALENSDERLRILNAGVRKQGYVEFGIPSDLSALGFAVFMSSPEIICALLDAGADPHLRYGAFSPLHIACVSGVVENINAWFRHLPQWDVNERDGKLGGVPVSICAKLGPLKLPALNALIDAGADDRLLAHTGGSLLNCACSNEDADPAAVRMLLGRGVDVNFHNFSWSHQTTKWRLIYNLASTLTRLRLIRSGILCDLAFEKNNTALHLAVQRGDYEIVKILLEEGHADPFIRNSMGQNALDYCDHSGPYPPIRELLLRHMRGRKRTTRGTWHGYIRWFRKP